MIRVSQPLSGFKAVLNSFHSQVASTDGLTTNVLGGGSTPPRTYAIHLRDINANISLDNLEEIYIDSLASLKASLFPIANATAYKLFIRFETGLSWTIQNSAGALVPVSGTPDLVNIDDGAVLNLPHSINSATQVFNIFYTTSFSGGSLLNLPYYYEAGRTVLYCIDPNIFLINSSGTNAVVTLATGASYARFIIVCVPTPFLVQRLDQVSTTLLTLTAATPQNLFGITEIQFFTKLPVS